MIRFYRPFLTIHCARGTRIKAAPGAVLPESSNRHWSPLDWISAMTMRRCANAILTCVLARPSAAAAPAVRRIMAWANFRATAGAASRLTRCLTTWAVIYAVALQAVLSVAAGPIMAAANAQPICASGTGERHQPPVGHSPDCATICLANCCAAPIAAMPAAPAIHAPEAVLVLAGVIADVAMPRLPSRRSHRSRAPPVS
jgi:hypothetical protein